MDRRTRAITRFLQTSELGVMLALLLLCIILRLTTPNFLTPYNLMQVARQASYYGIMAVGMVFVLVLGDVDLSVGSILTLANVVMALALQRHLPLGFALLAGLFTGALCGLVNGLLCVSLGIPMIIVTLGTLSVFRGCALLASNASPISDFPKDSAFFTIGGGTILGVPASVWVMVGVGVLGWIGLTRTRFGRHVQAIGGNARASHLSGLPIARYRVAVMTLNGMIAALAGIIALAFLQSADPSTGPGFELWVIASAIIGGTALSGGHGSVPGAILGALIIAIIRNGLVLLGFSAYAGTAVTGAVIILAVAIDAFVKRRSAARAVRKS